MSKVVCDICGTAFAETANQCPICGTAKTESTRPVAGAEGESAGYAYVKGGRFSQSNVRRHNSGKQELPRTVEERKPSREQQPHEEMEERVMAQEKPQRNPRPAPVEEEQERAQRTPRKQKREEPENEQPSNIGLIIIVVILLLAIIGVCAYIAIHWINANNEKKANNSTTNPSSSSSQFVEIPCTSILIPGAPSYTITDLSQTVMIEVICEPSNTTDLLNWDYDASIVDVTKSGSQWVITPVGSGETVITVSCGDQTASITVICDISNIPCKGVAIDGPASYNFTTLADSATLNVICDPVSTTEERIWTYDASVVSVTQTDSGWVITPVASGETDVTVSCGDYSASVKVTVDLDAGFVLEWACDSDITLTGYGTKWRIYKATEAVDISKIQFSSSDESIATVQNGYVYIWKNGDATITAAYGNQVITMTVRARKVEPPAEGQPNCTIYTNYGTSGSEFTIYVGDVLRLHLRDEEGNKLTDVTFSSANEEYLTVDAEGRITIVAPNKNGTYIYIEYQGYVFKCLVRVYEKTT